MWANMKEKINLAALETYIYIDVSNIRAACLKTLGFKIDFNSLIRYFERRYPSLRDIRYYEGIAASDEKKRQTFATLKRSGYTICPLERKAYTNPAVFKKVVCKKCGNEFKTQILKKSVSLKSNVDVYIATDILKIAYLAKKPTHIILLSCDGDYAEMVREAINTNPNIHISVIATPPVKGSQKNTLSTRLRKLFNEIPRYNLIDIRDIRNHISK